MCEVHLFELDRQESVEGKDPIKETAYDNDGKYDLIECDQKPKSYAECV